MNSAVTLWRPDKMLLAIYLIALFGLLLLPMGGPGIRLIGIGADKWMHIALFGGLAVLLRWNLAEHRHATFVSVTAAFVVVVATELAQSLVTYRSADLWDVAAGLLGAVLGAVIMNRIVSTPEFERSAGILVALLGLMVGALFALADVIGVGENNLFGTVQIAGTALGALISAGGIGVYIKASRGESRD